MIEKRFDAVINEFDEVEYISDIVDCEDRDFADFINYVNELANENEQLKELVHSMVEQMDMTVDYENTMYSAQIVCTGKQFELMRKISKGD